MRRFFYFAFICSSCWVLVFAAMCRAQTDSPTEMHLSLRECIDLALEENSQIVQNRFGVSVADVQVESARNAFLPSLTSSYRLSRQLTGPREGSFVDQATGEIITTLGDSETSGSQSVGASVSMDLYNPSNWANLSASKHGRKVAEMNLNTEEQQVVLQVKQGYFGLLQAIKLMQVQEEEVAVSEEDLRRAETLYEIHSVPLSDVLSTRATLESGRAALIERQNSVEVARVDLAFVMGSRLGVRLIPSEVEFEIRPLTLSLEEALDWALENRADLQSREFALRQAQDELKATQYGVRHPTLSMSAGYSWQLTTREDFGGLADLFEKNYGYSLNFNVNLPIFNRMSTENAVKTQKLNYLRSVEELEQAKRQVELDIRRTFMNIEQFRRSIEANEAAVRAAEESFKLAQERYDFGTGTQLERLQAQSSLFGARNNLVQAMFNYHLQLAQLEQAMGGLILEER